MKNVWIGVAVVFVAAGIASSAFRLPRQNQTIVVFPNGQTFSVEIADTASEQTQGLSDRSTPQSMLFLFDQKTRPGFWMKDMHFSIDIIWLDENRVVGFEKSAPPEEPPKTIYRPLVPITAVLEVPAGTVDKHTLQIGDALDIRIQGQ